MANKALDKGEYLVPHPKAASLPPDDSAVVVPKLLEFADSLRPKRRGAPPRRVGAKGPRGFGMEDVMKLLAIYQQLKPLIDQLFAKKPTPEPVPVPAPAPAPTPTPQPAGERLPASFDAKWYWVNRKETPWQAGGGRYLLSDAEKRKIFDDGEPLQAGDRATADVSPVDAAGVKFQPGDPANAVLVDMRHEALGIGELQMQDPLEVGYDMTPTCFIPWKHPDVKPGYQGEAGLRGTWRHLSYSLPMLRVRPWAEGPRGKAKPKAKRARR
jgi:hypothetical protein